MQTLRSDYQSLGAVKLPYQGRQVYMQAFDMSNPTLPQSLADYEPIVKSLLDRSGVAMTGTGYLTVDEKVVTAGMSQRRPGPHVDGCFQPELMDWGHAGGEWNHNCNNVPVPRMSIIVAASVAGCKAWRGTFNGEPTNGGDLSHLTLGDGEILQAQTGYLLTPDCIHESMRYSVDTERTFMRIALPVRS